MVVVVRVVQLNCPIVGADKAIDRAFYALIAWDGTDGRQSESEDRYL